MKKLFLLLCTISLFCISQTYAVYPYYNSYGWLLLHKEYEQSFYTKAKAIAFGVERWYNTYEWMINQYFNSGSFYQYIYIDGTWSNTYITPQVLAEQIHKDSSLELSDIPIDVVVEIENRIIYEDTYGPTSLTWSDPIDIWKWRSIYMERMYAENDLTQCIDIDANCWGTADYLAMDYEWADEYTSYFPNGATTWGDKFPHIFVFGNQNYENCIDDDLDPGAYGNGRAVFQGHRFDTASYPQPEHLLNSFDVIRLGSEPGSGQLDLEIGSINVGTNLHCVAYICTDQAHQAWVYEKHNNGCTRNNPYGLNILGNDQWTNPVACIGMYDDSYCSFFKKYGFNKINNANTWDLNWAGIIE